MSTKQSKGGSQSSDLVESHMSQAAYKQMDDRMSLSGGKRSRKSRTSKKGGKDVNMLSQLPVYSLDPLKAILYKSGGKLVLDLQPLLEMPLDKQEQVAQKAGNIANDFLSYLTPAGASKISQMLQDKSVIKGGNSISDVMRNVTKAVSEKHITGMMPLLSGGNATEKVVQSFMNSLSKNNTSNLMKALGFSGGSIASKYVEALMTGDAWKMLNSQATNKVGGTSIAAFDELYKQAKFEEYDIKGMNGGKRSQKKSKKGGSEGEILKNDWPHKNSLYNKPSPIDTTQQSLDMVRLNAQLDGIPRDPKVLAVASDMGSQGILKMQLGGKKKSQNRERKVK